MRFILLGEPYVFTNAFLLCLGRQAPSSIQGRNPRILVLIPWGQNYRYSRVSFLFLCGLKKVLPKLDIEWALCLYLPSFLSLALTAFRYLLQIWGIFVVIELVH